MALQRPLTRKEFVIQSLLAGRQPWATLVDTEEADPATPMARSDLEAPRPSSPSVVFELTRPARAVRG
jgi:hypothetical protein